MLSARAGAVLTAFAIAGALFAVLAPAWAKGRPARTAARGARGHAVYRSDWEAQPSARYAAMTADECAAELGKRGVEFTGVDEAPGVLAPVRLPNGVGGVVYRTEVAAHLRATNPFDVFDCRLVLALSDFSAVLQAHDIDEVLMFSAWRPPSKAWPEGKLGTRHPGGLAIDAYRFGKRLAPGDKEKRWLVVQTDFRGKLGAPVCGEAAAPAPSGSSPETKELRSILCEAADRHMFTAMLTPNFDRAHFNHFHLEVTPGVKWELRR